MTTQKHTPGKWTAFGIDVRSSPVVLEGKLIAETRDYPMGSRELEESYANARLIAAAPELLEALKNARAVVAEYECRGDEDCDHCQVIHHIIDPAIAKAERG